MKNVEVKFPLIEDITMEVAAKYGMIQPGESSTKAVRAVFVIDPKGIIRTIIYYPLSMGRNFDELLRVVEALKTADAFQVATPADWRPGEDVIVPTAGSCGTAKDRVEGKVPGVTCHDWFFCTKKLDKNQVLETITKKPISRAAATVTPNGSSPGLRASPTRTKGRSIDRLLSFH